MEVASLPRRPALGRRLAPWLVPAIYLAILGAFVWRDGVPEARHRLLLWVLLGLLALSATSLGRRLRSSILLWLPLVLVVWAYDLLRGSADGLLFSAHFTPQIEADRMLFGGTVPTVWLQDRLWEGARSLHWYDFAAWAVYMSYFAATYVVGGVLWFVARDLLRRYIACAALLAGMGLTTFMLFPAAPPWLASREGELDATTRSIGPISSEIPFVGFSWEDVIDRGSEYANPVAAVPSLHAAYTLLVVLFLWPLVPRWARPLLAAYPLAMTFALVYTAEHYVVDILLGWAYALAAVWAVNRLTAASAAGFARARSRPRGRHPRASRPTLRRSRSRESA